MGAHVIIVNNETFPIVRDKGLVAIFKESGYKRLKEKTKADILSDISCLRVGDRIFFYQEKIGFHGIYEVIDIPFIDETIIEGIEGANYRCQIRPKHYFKKPVSELRVFGFKNSAQKVHSIFYKKTLQRGKAITHLFPDEENFLTELLMKANDGISELIINPYIKPCTSSNIFFDLETKDNGELKYEKILEGWLIQNLDKREAHTDIFLGNIEDIECFANYIPVNIAGGNIDIMIFHKKKLNGIEKRYKVTIIELKKGNITQEAIIEIERYIKWAYENITNNDFEIIQPILIGKNIKDSAIEKCKHYSLNDRKPLLISYEVDKQNYFIKFNKVEY